MRIDSGVYLVGSGHMGFDLSNAYDCNVYLFNAGDSFVLFDAGAGLGVHEILALCRQDGVDIQKINHLFLSHAHADHSGGVGGLLEHVDATIYASKETAERVAVGEESLSLDAAKERGLYPKDYVYHPFKVDHCFNHDETFTIGTLSIRVIHTPGHSDDHHSFLVKSLGKTYLVAGDAIFHGGKVVLQDTPDCNVPKTIASIRLLSTYDFDALLPGHMNFSLKDGKRHIEAACGYIERFACPPALS